MKDTTHNPPTTNSDQTRIQWNKILEDAALWLTEAIIEGFIANTATHVLFGLRMNALTVVAYGFLIKETIDIWWRLRKDGPTAKVPDKDQPGKH